MKDNETKMTGRIRFLELLTIAFIVLKLVGVISWSWAWVLAPLWLDLLIIIILIVLSVIIDSKL